VREWIQPRLANDRPRSAKLLKCLRADAVQLLEVRLADGGELFKAGVPGGCEGSLRWLG
jgi:hypothetical protein